MKKSNKIDPYKKKIIELADKLLEKEKECSYLKELKRVHECRIINLEKQLDDDKRYKDLMNHIEQQDNKRIHKRQFIYTPLNTFCIPFFYYIVCVI